VRTIILRRCLQLIPVLLGVTFLTFSLVNLLPGNVAVAILGDNASPSQIKLLDVKLGLNHPILVRYFEWLGHALQGNLGRSLASGEPVITAVKSALPATLELMIYAEVISLALCLGLAFISVWTRSKILDRLITVGSLVGHCAPGFAVGLLFVLVFSQHLKLVSAFGYVPFSRGIGANLSAMALPGVTLALGIFPTQMRLFRGDMLEQLDNEDYVALARLKHLTKARIIFGHVAKNSAASLVTVVGLSIGLLIGGAVIVEQVFSMQGVGQVLLNAINYRDAPTVEGLVALIAVVVVVANLLVDLTYLALDPRLRTD
jgi:peptide/nickel transport system permease protein